MLLYHIVNNVFKMDQIGYVYKYFCRFRTPINPIVSYSYFDRYKQRDMSSIVCGERGFPR